MARNLADFRPLTISCIYVLGKLEPVLYKHRNFFQIKPLFQNRSIYGKVRSLGLLAQKDRANSAIYER